MNTLEDAMQRYPNHSPYLAGSHENLRAFLATIFRCPEYGLRYRGLQALRSWHSEDSLVDAEPSIEILEEAMKRELNIFHENRAVASLPLAVSFDTNSDNNSVIACIVYKNSVKWKGKIREYCVSLVKNESFKKTLLATHNSQNWACVRRLKVLE